MGEGHGRKESTGVLDKRHEASESERIDAHGGGECSRWVSCRSADGAEDVSLKIMRLLGYFVKTSMSRVLSAEKLHRKNVARERFILFCRRVL